MFGFDQPVQREKVIAKRGCFLGCGSARRYHAGSNNKRAMNDRAGERQTMTAVPLADTISIDPFWPSTS